MYSKKKSLFIVLCLWLLFPIVALSHNPSKSSTILVEGKNDHWTLQIRASLTAFEQVVHAEYTSKGYKTPEEFQDLMGTLLSKNLNLNIDDIEIQLNSPIIKLGHETIVVYEFVPPAGFQKVKFKNTLFQNINSSDISFMVLKNGSKRNLFKLNKDNNYSTQVQLENNEFILEQTPRGLAGISFNWYLLAGILSTGAIGMIFKSRIKR